MKNATRGMQHSSTGRIDRRIVRGGSAIAFWFAALATVALLAGSVAGETPAPHTPEVVKVVVDDMIHPIRPGSSMRTRS